ncbi:hypothetical protein TrST_g1805 [Triparma strigata]|uniref:Uncharacterized protein n=1 Tax=Triparma strigata TaxID=1606541 RepID=A0A9W7EUZ5_9STRA|nr:hypothetical protein TrST_g1805 [Triparma strigata]
MVKPLPPTPSELHSLQQQQQKSLRIQRLLQVRSQTSSHSNSRLKTYQSLRRSSLTLALESSKSEFKSSRQNVINQKSIQLKKSLLGVGLAHEHARAASAAVTSKRKFLDETREEDKDLAKSRGVLASKVLKRDAKVEALKIKESLERRHKVSEFQKCQLQKILKKPKPVTPDKPLPPSRYKSTVQMNVQADTFSNFGFNESVSVKIDKSVSQKNEIEEEKIRLQKTKESTTKLLKSRDEVRLSRGKAALKKSTGERASLGIEASLKSLLTREKLQRSKGGLKKVNFTLIEKEKRKGKGGERRRERVFEKAFLEKKEELPFDASGIAVDRFGGNVTQEVWDLAKVNRQYVSTSRSSKILKEAGSITENNRRPEERIWEGGEDELKDSGLQRIEVEVEEKVQIDKWESHDKIVQLTGVKSPQTSPGRRQVDTFESEGSSEPDSPETREAATIVAGLMTNEYVNSNRYGRTLSGNEGENRFKQDWMEEYRFRESERIGTGEEMTGRTEYTFGEEHAGDGLGLEHVPPLDRRSPPVEDMGEKALRRLGVEGPRVRPPLVEDFGREETPEAVKRVERLEKTVDGMRGEMEGGGVMGVMGVRESGALLDTPSHVTSFGGGNDTTIESYGVDTTGGRSFQTSSEESYEKGQKESPTISEGSGRSKVSGSSEERALDAAAKFLSDLSGVEGGGAEMLKEGEVDNEAKLSMDEIKDMIEKVEKETEQEMLNMSLGSFDPNNTNVDTSVNTSGAVGKSSSDESNVSQGSIVLEEVDKLQEVVRGLKQRNMTFEPKMDELKRQMEEMEKEKEEMEKSLRSLSNSEGGSRDDDSEEEVQVAVMREEKTTPTMNVSSVEPTIPALKDDEDDNSVEDDDLTMHTLNSSVDTFATKSIDENNQMKAAMRALASPGFEGQGETQNILSNYNLEDSVDEKDVSFKTDEGDDEEEVIEDLKNMSIAKDEEEDDDDDEETADLKNMSLVSDASEKSEEVAPKSPIVASNESDDDDDEEEEEGDLSMHTIRTSDRNTLEEEVEGGAELASALSFNTESDVSVEDKVEKVEVEKVEVEKVEVEKVEVEKVEVEKVEVEEVEVKEEVKEGEEGVSVAPSTVAGSTVATGVMTQRPLDTISKAPSLKSQALSMGEGSEGEETASILTGGDTKTEQVEEKEVKEKEGKKKKKKKKKGKK